MDKKVASPWLAVTIGIAGLIVGYGFVLSQQGNHVFARAVRCPATIQNTCAKGVCTKECPHNCIDPAA